MGLDPFQAEVAEIALAAAGEHGFALAGGNALVAHGVVERDTQDVDLFSDEAGGPGAVTGPVRAALEAAGYQVEVTRPPDLNMGEFARLVVRRGDDAMQLDMARDWRKWPPVRLQVGPVLHLDDAVSSKVTAMVGGGPRETSSTTASTPKLSATSAPASPTGPATKPTTAKATRSMPPSPKRSDKRRGRIPLRALPRSPGRPTRPAARHRLSVTRRRAGSHQKAGTPADPPEPAPLPTPYGER